LTSSVESPQLLPYFGAGGGIVPSVIDLTPDRVFTPNAFPEHTYISRDDEKPEGVLREAMREQGSIVSISGPSKSGKTVLVEHVFGQSNVIEVSGAEIDSPDMLWNRVLDKLGAPEKTIRQVQTTRSKGIQLDAGGEVGVPLIAKSTLDVTGSASHSNAYTDRLDTGRTGATDVVSRLANTSYVLLLDDFHYMTESVQTAISQNIRGPAREGVRICIASVPYRSDDIIRSNNDLQGRVSSIDLEYWTLEDTSKIAMMGFDSLGMNVSNEVISELAQEASGSPQLMQALCLSFCSEVGSRDKSRGRSAITEIDLAAVCKRVVGRTNYKSLVHKLLAGPKLRGKQRSPFIFKDGSSGDVYRCMLLAIKGDPPRLSLPYTELLRRVETVCKEERPVGQSITRACAQMSEICKEGKTSLRALEWNGGRSCLDISDPYFLFYLRWSGAL